MTVNTKTLEGNWNEIKGKIREKWGQVSDDELQRARGNSEQLIGLIQRKSGQAREEVEDYLEEITNEDESVLKRAKDTVKEYTSQATETVQGATRQAAESVRAGYEQTSEMVARRPMESLAVCFGAGLLTGVVVGLAMRSR